MIVIVVLNKSFCVIVVLVAVVVVVVVVVVVAVRSWEFQCTVTAKIMFRNGGDTNDAEIEGLVVDVNV
jgi:hypothetical protein